MVDRIFKATDRHGAEVEFELVEPGMVETNEADMQYRTAFSRALQHGILPRERMIEEMRRHEIWDKQTSDEIAGLAAELVNLEAELDKVKDEAKGLEVAAEMSKKRNRLWELISAQQGPLANSCEGVAAVIREEALMAACVRIKSSNQRYWKDYRAYVTERDGENSGDVVIKVMDLQGQILLGQQKDIVGKQPEQLYLGKIKKQEQKKASPVRKKATKKKAVRKRKT